MKDHADNLDNHIVAISHDVGTGAMTGYWTSGSESTVDAANEALSGLSGLDLGSFNSVESPLVGTDNYDFMVEGLPNMVAAQADGRYGSNYHAESDTFDKVDIEQLKKNAVIAAAGIWWFANSDWKGRRLTRTEISDMIDRTGLQTSMETFDVWNDWLNGTRGRN